MDSEAPSHERAADNRPVYVLRGEEIQTLEDFYREIGQAMNGPGGYFGTNLDALWDCLSGGFGTPDEGGYIVRWVNSDVSREALGYDETVRQLRKRYAQTHPSAHDHIREQIDAARRHVGPTVFDWLVHLLSDAREFGAELELR